MRLYDEYKETKQVHEGVGEWILIRKMKFRHQCVVISLLLVAWLMAAPYLVFWVNFFKGALLLCLLILSFHIGKKILLYLIRRRHDRYKS
jgi:hypothetical protein